MVGLITILTELTAPEGVFSMSIHVQWLEVVEDLKALIFVFHSNIYWSVLVYCNIQEQETARVEE